MDIKELLVKGFNLILDPVAVKMTAPQFIAEFGGNLAKIYVLAKHPSGQVFYDSKVAPRNIDFGDFFSKILDISAGIFDVYAVINTLLDSHKSEDPKYASYKSGGEVSKTHICPTSANTIGYLSQIVKEIAQLPVKGIIFTGNSFINKNYCFCENCKNEFSAVSGIPTEFDFNRIQIDEELLAKWSRWRSDKISSLMINLTNQARHVNEKLEIFFELYLDPASAYNENMELEYGQNFEALSSVANIIVNLHPWTPILPEVNSAEYKALVNLLMNMKSTKLKSTPTSLLHWNITSEEDLEIVNSISKSTGAEGVYTYNQYPANYSQLREAYLGR